MGGGAERPWGVDHRPLPEPCEHALGPRHHLEAIGAYSPESQRYTVGLAIVDSVINTSHLSGGVAATWNEFDPSGVHRVWTDVRGGLAMPLGDYLSFGVMGRWLHVDQAVSAGPFGPSLASDGTAGGPLYNALTFDLGATASLGNFRLGLVGHNLTNPGTLSAPTTMAGGIGTPTPPSPSRSTACSTSPPSAPPRAD